MGSLVKVCKCCGKEFIPSRPSIMFCSPRCAQRFWQREKLDQRIEAVSERGKEIQRNALIDQNFLSLSDAARLINVSRNTLYKIIEEREIPLMRCSARTVRIARRDLESYLSLPSAEKSSGVGSQSGLANFGKVTEEQREKNGSSAKGDSESRVRKAENREENGGRIAAIAVVKTAGDEQRLEADDKWSTLDELAQISGLAKDSVRRFCKLNNIRMKKIGSISYVSKVMWDKTRRNDIDLSQYYTPSQLMEKYGITLVTLNKYLKIGGVHKVKIGTFAYYPKTESDNAMNYKFRML